MTPFIIVRKTLAIFSLVINREKEKEIPTRKLYFYLYYYDCNINIYLQSVYYYIEMSYYFLLLFFFCPFLFDEWNKNEIDGRIARV